MTRKRQASHMDNLKHETTRADHNSACLTAAACASLELIRNAILADERGRTYGDQETDPKALEWRSKALMALDTLRASLLSSEVNDGA